VVADDAYVKMHMKPMTRRDFLATTSVAAGAAMLPVPSIAARQSAPATSSPSSSPKRTLKKAVGYGMVAGDAPIMDKFKLLRDLGFEGVEMDRPSSLDPDEILKARDATGLEIHGIVDSVHWSDQLNNPNMDVRAKGVSGLVLAMRDAHQFGASSVLLVPAVVNKDMPYDQAWTASQAGIRQALSIAEELKIIIAIENVWNNFLLSPLEARRYVDEFKSPFVQWHFDIGNVINYGWPAQWIEILGPHIVKLHIKDYSRKKRDKEGLWKGFDVQLGEGDADWPATMKALDASGYSTDPAGRWATAEVSGGDEQRLKQIAAQMDLVLGA
jgi:hexulose-6-phosphate isomerase